MLHITSNIYFSILPHVPYKLATELCSSQSLWGSGLGRRHHLNTRWRENREPYTSSLVFFFLSQIWSFFFFKNFFGCGPFLKSLLNLLQYCFCFTLWVFGEEACRVLASQSGTEPSPFALEGEVLTTGPSGKSPYTSSWMLCSELTWMIFAQISLDKATHMAASNIKRAEKLTPLVCPEGQERLVSTAHVENHLVTRRSKHNWEYPGEGRQFLKKSERINCR